MSEVMLVNDANFEAEVLKSDKPVLVDFFASWCGPCRMMAPVIDEIAEKMADKIKTVKLDTDANFSTSVKYGIMSVPTIIFFKNGLEATRFIGYQPKEAIENKLQSLI